MIPIHTRGKAWECISTPTEIFTLENGKIMFSLMGHISFGMDSASRVSLKMASKAGGDITIPTIISTKEIGRMT